MVFNKKSVALIASIASCAAIFFIAARADGGEKTPLRVVASVDLKQYAGRWYEIARLPNRFEDKKNDSCGYVTAEYALRNDGKISVRNRCVYQKGKIEIANGVARVTDRQTNARLEVNFAPSFLSIFPFVWGDYNIMELAPDYSYALIGNTDRKGLWILSRTPQLSNATYARLMEVAAQQGFDVQRVTKTKQEAQ